MISMLLILHQNESISFQVKGNKLARHFAGSPNVFGIPGIVLSHNSMEARDRSVGKQHVRILARIRYGIEVQSFDERLVVIWRYGCGTNG